MDESSMVDTAVDAAAQSAKSPRERLVEAGIRLLEENGPEALQARKVAAEIGASTMAVYTYFGGMPGLLAAIVGESFARFGAALQVPETADPVTDLFRMGAAYRDYAFDNPQRYRLMFGLAAPQTLRPLLQAPTPDDPLGEIPDSDASFGHLLRVVGRMIEVGRIREGQCLEIAAQLWGLTHGIVLLELAGFVGDREKGVGLAADAKPSASPMLGAATIALLVGMGDDRALAEQSRSAAFESSGAGSGID